MNLIKDLKENRIFEELLKASTLEEIIKILDKDDYDKYYILGCGIHDFILECYNGDKKVKKKLQNKIKMYRKFLLAQKRQQREIENQKRKILQKEVFDYCTKVNWELPQIQELSTKLGVRTSTIKKLAFKYAKEHLSPEEFQKLYQRAQKIFLETKKTTTDNTRFYRLKLEVINPILLELLHKETYNLWDNLGEKELVLEYIYKYCMESEWDKNELEKLAKRLKIDVNEIRSLAKEYAKKMLSPEEFELLKIKINKAFSKDILSKEEIEILQKNLFDYCTKVNWNLSKIEELAKELDLTVNIIKKLALRQAKEQFPPEEYNLFYKQVTKTIKDTTKQSKDSILNYRQKLEVINPILLEKLNKSTYWLWESLAEKEIVLKDIYDYCKMNNWSSNKLEEYANRLSITTTKLKELAKEYAKKTLSSEELEQLKIKINEAATFIRPFKLTVKNPILLEKLNKVTYWLWENPIEKEIVLEYIYQSCENLKVNNSNINQLASRLHISIQKIDELYKDYVLNYLKWTESQYFQKKQEYMSINQKGAKSEIKKIYDALLTATTLEEIKKIIEDSNLQLETIRFSILTYTNTYQNCNPEITENLKEKIGMYINYVSKQKKEQNLEKNLSIITLFINDLECDTIAHFCKKNNISSTSFIKYTLIAAENDPELYAKYSKKILLTNNHKSSIVKEIRTLIMYLKTGIEEHGIIRPFDIIDYYSTTKILLKYILEVVEPIITKDDYNLLKAFVEQNTDDSMDNNVNKIMPNETTPINESLINFLTQNKIPLNQKTYCVAYNRYINGTLDLNLSAKSK